MAIAKVADRALNGAGAALEVVYSATWPAGAETRVGQSTPWTWGANSTYSIGMNFMYEAAS